ncbi:hypothetical protein [Rhizobium mongolense]|nr:hypothetical protein [Rhizobium mongolense]
MLGVKWAATFDVLIQLGRSSPSCWFLPKARGDRFAVATEPPRAAFRAC